MVDRDALLAETGLGRIGVWTFDFDRQPAALIREQIAELDALGFGAIWVPEVDNGRESFSLATLLLASSARIAVATGIARIRDRSPRSMAAGQRLLDDAFPGRFVLGLGGPPAVDRPLEAVRGYLDEMEAVALAAAAPAASGPRLLAGYGPAMLRLAGERTAGAHTYKVNLAHTAETRAILGPRPLLAVEHAVLLESDPERAREVARQHLATYLRTPFNLAKFRRLGYGEDELGNGGSDRFVDDFVAWGTADDIVPKLRAHVAAGADHVAMQVIGVPPRQSALPQWRLLAEALLE